MKIFNHPVKLSAILLAVIVLLIFLHYIKILIPVENLAVRIFSPGQNQIYSLGVKINNFYNIFRLNKDLQKSNSQFEEQIKNLTIENSQLKTTLWEKQDLDKQLDFLNEAGLQAIPAKVIGKNSELGYQTLILNKGRKDGVEIGLSVVADKGLIIGKVMKFSEYNCQILLINDSRSSLAAVIQNEAKSKGVVVGERGLSLKMELISVDDIVKPDDVVITSGLEVNIPRGLVIGRIEQITSPPNSFFQTALLQPLVNFDDLIVVSILKYHD